MLQLRTIKASDVPNLKGRPGVVYMVEDPPFTKYYWNGTQLVGLDPVPQGGGGYSLVMPDGSTRQLPRVLKSTLAQYQLTGGTVGVKTTLLQIQLPDGLFLDYGSHLRLQVAWFYTNNTNSKSFGVDLGQDAGSAVNLANRTRSSASHGQESWDLVVTRHPTDTVRLMEIGNNGVATFGQAPPATTTDPRTSLNIDPALTGLSLYVWGRLDTANTDQVSLVACLASLHSEQA